MLSHHKTDLFFQQWCLTVLKGTDKGCHPANGNRSKKGFYRFLWKACYVCIEVQLNGQFNWTKRFQSAKWFIISRFFFLEPYREIFYQTFLCGGTELFCLKNGLYLIWGGKIDTCIFLLKYSSSLTSSVKPLVEMAANLNAYQCGLDGHEWYGAVRHVVKLVNPFPSLFQRKQSGGDA